MFESRVMQKTARMRERSRAKEAPDDEDVAYLLQAVPFIRQYTEEGGTPTETPASPDAAGTVQQFVHVTTDTNTGHIYDQYMATVEGDPEAMARVAMDPKDTNTCDCGEPLRYSPVDSTMLCTACGTTKTHIEIGTRGLNYDEQVDHASKRAFTYKRISHFIECLNASQAKQNTSIPDEVLDAITSEMKKYRMSPESLTATHVRAFLKRRGLSKFYEHVNYILSLINHTKKTTIPKHVEETLVKMFIATQKPFDSVADADRVNFLRYNYIIYKMLEIIGETEYLEMFPLLKSRNKLIQHDQVWKRICEHPQIQWPFIPTI